jgi:hypothetical protein
MIELRVGRYIRQRVFKPAPYGHNKWWIIGVTSTDPEASATGSEIVEVVEVIDTKTQGKLVVYQQWVIDPDGTNVELEWIPRRTETKIEREPILRGALKRMSFKAERPRLRVVDGAA